MLIERLEAEELSSSGCQEGSRGMEFRIFKNKRSKQATSNDLSGQRHPSEFKEEGIAICCGILPQATSSNPAACQARR